MCVSLGQTPHLDTQKLSEPTLRPPYDSGTPFLRTLSLSSPLAATTVSTDQPLLPISLRCRPCITLPPTRCAPFWTVGPTGPLASLGHRLQLPSESSLTKVLSSWWWLGAAAGYICQTSGTWSRPSCGDSAAKHAGSVGLVGLKSPHGF